MANKLNEEREIKILFARSAKNGKFFEKKGLFELSDVIKYAIDKTN
jgi:hypothetical protein